MSCQSLRSTSLAISEFKRIYLTQCIHLGLAPKREVLDIIHNITNGNESFERIDLNRSGIDDNSVIPIVAALKTNWTVRDLILSHNQIKDLAIFQDLLDTNKYIEGLDLSNNSFSRAPAQRFASYLQSTTNLKWFDLNNGLDTQLDRRHAYESQNDNNITFKKLRNCSQEYYRTVPRKPNGPTEPIFIRTNSAHQGPYSTRSTGRKPGLTEGLPHSTKPYEHEYSKTNSKLLMSRMEWILQIKEIYNDLVLEFNENAFHKKFIIRAILRNKSVFPLLEEESYKAKHLDKGHTLKQIIQAIQGSEKLFLTYDDIIEKISTIGKKTNMLEDDLFPVSYFTRDYTNPDDDVVIQHRHVRSNPQGLAANASFNDCSLSTDMKKEDSKSYPTFQETRKPLTLDFRKLATFSVNPVAEQPQFRVETSFRQEINDMQLVSSARQFPGSNDFTDVSPLQSTLPFTSREQKESQGETYRGGHAERAPIFIEAERKRSVGLVSPLEDKKPCREAWTQCDAELNVDDHKQEQCQVQSEENKDRGVKERQVEAEHRIAGCIDKEEKKDKVTIETQTEIIEDHLKEEHLIDSLGSDLEQKVRKGMEGSERRNHLDTIYIKQEYDLKDNLASTPKDEDKTEGPKQRIIAYDLPLSKNPIAIETANIETKENIRPKQKEEKQRLKEKKASKKTKMPWKAIDISNFTKKSQARKLESAEDTAHPLPLNTHEVPIIPQKQPEDNGDIEVSKENTSEDLVVKQSILEEIRDLLKKNFANQMQNAQDLKVFHDFHSFTKPSTLQDSQGSPKILTDLDHKTPESLPKKNSLLESPTFVDYKVSQEDLILVRNRAGIEQSDNSMEEYISQQIEEGSIKVKDLLKGYMDGGEDISKEWCQPYNPPRSHKEGHSNDHSATIESHHMGDTQMTFPTIQAIEQSQEMSRCQNTARGLDSSSEEEHIKDFDGGEQKISIRDNQDRRGVAYLIRFKEVLEGIGKSIHSNSASDEEITAFSQLSRFMVHQLGIDSIVSFSYDLVEDPTPLPLSNEIFQILLKFAWGIKITNIPDPASPIPFLWHQNIHILNLSGNSLTNVDFITHLRNLEYLNLNYNNIQDYPNLSCGPTLKELHLSHNKLSQISFLYRYEKLSLLDLSFNDIVSYESLANLSINSRLQVLNLRGNPLTKKPHYIKTLKNILPHVPGLDVFDESLSSFRKYEQLSYSEIGPAQRLYRTFSSSTPKCSRPSVSSSRQSENRTSRSRSRLGEVTNDEKVVGKKPVTKPMQIANWELIHRRAPSTVKPSTERSCASTIRSYTSYNKSIQGSEGENVICLSLKRGDSSSRKAKDRQGVVDLSRGGKASLTERCVPGKKVGSGVQEHKQLVAKPKGMLNSKETYVSLYSSKRVDQFDKGSKASSISISMGYINKKTDDSLLSLRSPIKGLPHERKVFRK